MTRFLSGIALAGAVLAAVLFLSDLALRVLACLVAIAAAHEYLAVLHRDGRAPRALPVLLLVVLVCWWVSAPERRNLLVPVLLGLAWMAVEVVFRGLTLDRAAARFIAPLYIGMPLGMLAAVQGLGGRTATLLLIGTIVVSDSAQFYTGRLFGRRPLAPMISPKKTVEGAVGGAFVATLFLALAGSRLLPAAGAASLAVLGIAVVALGICGDLFESRLKRAADLKDSSALIPGHGGILDRIDALLFAAPAYYIVVRFV